MKQFYWGALALLLIFAGCEDEPAYETITYENEGRLCLRGSKTEGADVLFESDMLEEDQTVFVKVFFPTCLSSSCDTQLETSCSVALIGNDLVVDSSGSYETPVGDPICTLDCGVMSASCEAPPLPAGNYTVTHGDYSGVLTIPSSVSSCFANSENSQSNFE